ncbi:MAG: SDR family oxidoreductase [Oligoflexales bacterium]|nr:SDR family oxidoreductase [Oligoflexales bacterium]
MKTVLITGGGGYVGAILVPKLIQKGYKVIVLDLMIYGTDVFDNIDAEKSHLTVIKGDIRDVPLLQKTIPQADYVIHLACISNDPSFDLNPELGKSINLDSFRPLVEISRKSGVEKFIYASSSSVYGVKNEPDVHEEMSLSPLTDYSKYKAMCETILSEYDPKDFCWTVIRPATVCGYSPRQRLDVIVNILTNHAYHNRVIKVFGGDQKRPNIHIEDMTDLYVRMLEEPSEKISGKIYNSGSTNYTVIELAHKTQKIVGDDVKLEFHKSDDPRSYHISSEKLAKEIGFVPRYSIEDAVADLTRAFNEGKLPNAMSDHRYYNIKTMLDLNLA